jgi:ribosomal protein S18 acetylase RimI-like enzyme
MLVQGPNCTDKEPGWDRVRLHSSLVLAADFPTLGPPPPNAAVPQETCTEFYFHNGGRQVLLVSLISLAAVIEPQELKPAARSPRSIGATDLAELADLYLHAYSDGTSHPDKEKAADRISAVFEGALGTPIHQASLLTVDAGGRVTAAIVILERALGNNGSKTAFIAELFTHPDNRREGLAEELLSHALQALHETGHKTIAVTVDSANAAAIALYLSRDFRRLTQAAAND